MNKYLDKIAEFTGVSRAVQKANGVLHDLVKNGPKRDPLAKPILPFAQKAQHAKKLMDIQELTKRNLP